MARNILFSVLSACFVFLLGASFIGGGSGGSSVITLNAPNEYLIGTGSIRDHIFVQIKPTLPPAADINADGPAMGFATYLDMSLLDGDLSTGNLIIFNMETTGSTAHSIQDLIGINGSAYPYVVGTARTIIGGEFYADMIGTGTVTDGNYAIQAYGYATGAETVPTVASLYTQSSANDATALYGALIDSNTGTTVTTNYGLRIKDQAVAGATNYAIHTGAGKVVLGGLSTGTAGSKKVVCYDTTTKELIYSSTSTDCSN